MALKLEEGTGIGCFYPALLWVECFYPVLDLNRLPPHFGMLQPAHLLSFGLIWFMRMFCILTPQFGDQQPNKVSSDGKIS